MRGQDVIWTIYCVDGLVVSLPSATTGGNMAFADYLSCHGGFPPCTEDSLNKSHTSIGMVRQHAGDFDARAGGIVRVCPLGAASEAREQASQILDAWLGSRPGGSGM